MNDLSAQYLNRWKSEYLPSVNGEEPRMITAEDRLPAISTSPNPYTGRPSGPVGVRGVKGPMPAGNIADEGGNTQAVSDMLKGAVRSAIELFGFPARAVSELGASGAGSRMVMGASQKAPPGYDMGEDLAVSAETGSLPASPDDQAKIQKVIDDTFEAAKVAVGAEPTEGSQKWEQTLGIPFIPLTWAAQTAEEYVMEKTGDPLLAKAAGLAAMMGVGKAIHTGVREGKLVKGSVDALGIKEGLSGYLEDLRTRLPEQLVSERGSIEIPGKRDVKPVEWDKFETLIKSAEPSPEGKPGRLNYDRMEIPDTVKEVMAGIDELYGKRIEETIGAPHTLEKVYEEAKANPMTVPELLRYPDNAPMTDLDITRARLLHGAVGQFVLDQAKKVAEGDKEAVSVRDAALALAARIQEKKESVTAAIARGLGSHRIMAEVGDYEAAGLSKFAENLARLKKKGVNDATINEAILGLETPEQLAVFARSLQRATKPQMFLEAWINGLLSGPQTHAANMTGNLAVAAVLIEERQMASFLPSWGKEPGVAMGEAGAMLQGSVLGIVDGLRLAAKTIRTGESQFVSDKYEYLLSKNQQPVRKAITAENLGLSGPLGVGVDFVGNAIRLPGVFLGAEDALFKGMAQRMELHAQAYRKASVEGLRGKEFGDRVSYLVDHPTEEMVVSASEFADYATFTKELGATGQSAQRFLNSHPMIKVFLPFFRTPTNIMKFVGERTPLGLLSESVRADIARGGATGQLAVAKLVNGSLILGTAAVLAQAGYMTGSGPKNRSQRQLWIQDGWQPYSLNIGGKYYDMARFEPVGTLMGIAADIALINEFNQGEVDEKDIEDLAVSAALAGYQVFSMKSYLAGVGSWLEAINDPDRHGSRVISQLAGSVVPSIVAQGSQAYVDPKIREVRDSVDAIMARIPGLSDKLEARLDIFGREQLRPGRLGPDIASPMKVSEAKKDPVLDEMNRLGMAVAMPSRFVLGKSPGGAGLFGVEAKDSPWHGVELKPKEYTVFVKLAGNAYKDDTEFGNVGTYDYLKAAIQSPEYQVLPEDPNAPAGTKQVFIKQVIYRYRMQAKAWMTENSDRLSKIQEKKERDKETFGESGKVPQIRIGQ
jgi:hypothetical protein